MADLVLGLRSKRELCLLKWALLSALCQPTGTTAEQDAARHTKHGATGGSRREQGHGSTAAKHLTKGALQDRFHPKLLRGLGASQSNSKDGSMKAFVGTTWKGRKIRNKQTGKVQGKPPNNCVCLPALGGDFHQTAEPPPLSHHCSSKPLQLGQAWITLLPATPPGHLQKCLLRLVAAVFKSSMA